MKIKLYTKNGNFVYETSIPPFKPAPDVIMWGYRTFIIPPLGTVLPNIERDEFQYTECFAYNVV